MAYKISAFLVMTLLVSILSISSAQAVDEFSPRFTNKAPAAFGDDVVNPQDLIARQDDELTAEELNAIMPAAGDVQSKGLEVKTPEAQKSPETTPAVTDKVNAPDKAQ